ncbi:MAG TPA: DUF692 family protein [Nitrospira sp.]|nr:DUF692 family protein [Nitrospira sp.]
MSIEQEFHRRLHGIPSLGLGLSVDVYSPDLFDLMDELTGRGLRPGYLEIFKASTASLAAVRRRFPDIGLAYHAEGLWVTQPDFAIASSFEEDLADTVTHLRTLHSSWLNHECATKQMAGYSFGTYLPPLYTALSAGVVAENVALIQHRIDRAYENGVGPLLLLEMAPLTYFAAGTINVPEFFRLIVDRVSCGLVLDIGHLWTLYRYTAARYLDTLGKFVEKFLDQFPLERVVEIHVAGLSEHGASPADAPQHALPAWLDCHAASIPSVLWKMLQQVLSHPGLTNLRAVALEVDTKSISAIAEEYGWAVQRFGHLIRRKCEGQSPLHETTRSKSHGCFDTAPAEADKKHLADQYARYARIITGQERAAGLEWQEALSEGTGLNRYIHEYLPHEILRWGGVLTEMFPDTWRTLARYNVTPDGFFTWWVKTVGPLDEPYDFFLLKIARFVEFVAETAPALRVVAEREADMLRRAYREANEHVAQPTLSEIAG